MFRIIYRHGTEYRFRVIEAASIEDAVRRSKEVAGPWLVHEVRNLAGEWEPDGTGDDGQPMERRLVWTSESDSEGDDGSRAVCEMERDA